MRPSGYHLVEHGSQGIQLRPGRYLATAHELGDHVGLVLFFSQVEDGDYVGMGT